MTNSRSSDNLQYCDEEQELINGDDLIIKLFNYVEGQIGKEIKVSVGDVLRLAEYLNERNGMNIREVEVKWVDESDTGGVT
ncbi:MAG: hypothetical protein HY820_10940 [Acidobacteria bacterium]|nr:hypothetical protein [Acidobacteriota bacterium]